ncbi:nucleoside 2-deoxyribosyltransferase [Patescibacteria group bacterium]|nr:nucleoside 2-deoxyribosyltransferase [Patescibacteria group bacterium]MCL5091840.1 nucleoside 2-deoxyribosyltransferase [Patescibacteria group bacterium]
MLKVYFTASTSADPVFHAHYKKIFQLINRLKCRPLSGQQIIDPTLLRKDKQRSPAEIFKREKQLIDQADLVVAEVSQPSLGVGSEIAYALTRAKPTLALMYENHQDRISPMISGNPSENLFLESYNFSRLRYVIKDFIDYLHQQKKRRGKLIVVDGGNASGKTTQSKLLVDYLQHHGIKTKYVDFPQYYTSFHGKTVAKFLRGEFGTLDQVSPYLASLAFALDRASIKREMDDFLRRGGYIVANRYATSSLAHQAAKFANPKEQNEFLNWLYDLEYKVHKIPKENVVIYLYVPAAFSRRLNRGRGGKAYLNGKSEDIEEKDYRYSLATEKMYLQLAQHYRHWVKIDCVEQRRLLSPQQIHATVIDVLRQKHLLV